MKNWGEFWVEKERVKKFREAFIRNEVRYSKAMAAYEKILSKLSNKHNLPNGIAQLLNTNFFPS